MNIIGYVPILISALDTIVRGRNMQTVSDSSSYSVEAAWRGCRGNPAYTYRGLPSLSLGGWRRHPDSNPPLRS